MALLLALVSTVVASANAIRLAADEADQHNETAASHTAAVCPQKERSQVCCGPSTYESQGQPWQLGDMEPEACHKDAKCLDTCVKEFKACAALPHLFAVANFGMIKDYAPSKSGKTGYFITPRADLVSVAALQRNGARDAMQPDENGMNVVYNSVPAG
eukprot:TRINITY_DN12563_c0_g2_i4.p1 TRINITY_DN12563_c0_g2~~TRINITY_DN12563_c0_g2_i4.p1  ORF type:complete len:158 (-),score=19.18 TRINITY_DN12563_c0_g2_i4:1045-1518(-)